MRFTKLVLTAATLAAPLSAAQAQDFSTGSTPNLSGAQFWDVISDDDPPGCNIGYVLGGATSVSSCQNYNIRAGYTNAFAANLSDAWYAHALGDQGTSVGFSLFGNTGTTVTYWGGIAGASPLRKLFIRDILTGGVVHTFDITDSDSWVYSFESDLHYDIGIETFQPGDDFFSSMVGVPNQFAIFGGLNGAGGEYGSCFGTAGCWVGAEDRAMSDSDYDYNDGLLHIAGGTVVPEPSTYALMAVGLAGLVAVRRRRSNV